MSHTRSPRSLPARFYQKQGEVDILELRRTILANLPAEYEGFNKYWEAGKSQ